MNKIICLFLLSAVVSGCAFNNVVSRTVSINPQIQKQEVLELASDVAKSLNLLEVTKLDRENGIVEFGPFNETSVISVSAQVRVKEDNKNADITVRRVSVYFPLPVKSIADEFQTELQAILNK